MNDPTQPDADGIDPAAEATDPVEDAPAAAGRPAEVESAATIEVERAEEPAEEPEPVSDDPSEVSALVARLTAAHVPELVAELAGEGCGDRFGVMINEETGRARLGADVPADLLRKVLGTS